MNTLTSNKLIKCIRLIFMTLDKLYDLSLLNSHFTFNFIIKKIILVFASKIISSYEMSSSSTDLEVEGYLILINNKLNKMLIFFTKLQRYSILSTKRTI